MFLTGETLKKILFDMDIKYASFYCFSDEVGFAKPDRRMYATSSCHVGDNILTDVNGPRKFGIPTYLINSNDKTISDAVEFILQTTS
jgi:FMN phosphatase YigB (HAD superfamily)